MIQRRKRFYKYVTVEEDVKRWGIYVTGAGHITVSNNTRYPLADDPSHHYFQWSTGRRISDYQLLYIISGKGVFETELTGIRKINAGDIFILFPGIWHRFTPDTDTGWEEYWVEFNGDLIKHYRTMDFLNPENPVLKVGINEEIAQNFLKILTLISDERPGFQYVASGNLVQILGQAFTSIRYHQFEGRKIENQIKQAKLMLLEYLNNPVSQEEVALTVGLGYSVYRKKFKEYTGISPLQYQLNLKINRAKDLLITSVKSTKEIASNLGFDSQDYFCRLFKNKTGYTPSEYREKNNR